MIESNQFRLFVWHSKILFQSIKQKLRETYAGSGLGIFWTILYPLGLLSIYAVLYVYIFKIQVPGLKDPLKYTLHIFSGLVPLIAFSSGLTSASASIASNKHIILNLTFPSHLIPVREVLTAQVTAIVGIMYTLMLSLYLGSANFPSLVLLPLLVASLSLFTIGLGFFLSLLNIVFKDIQHGISLVLTILFIASPFAYIEEMVPDNLKLIYSLNPLTYFITSFQAVLSKGVFPNTINLIFVFSISLFVFIIGRKFFRSSLEVFNDFT
jgi:lipopolysaccharide transport system permease protein